MYEHALRVAILYSRFAFNGAIIDAYGHKTWRGSQLDYISTCVHGYTVRGLTAIG